MAKAEDDAVVEVVACNFAQGWILRADGIMGDVKRMIDRGGEDTDDAAQAALMIVQWGDGQWSPIELHKTIETTH